jgi:hypothetical protein
MPGDIHADDMEQKQGGLHEYRQPDLVEPNKPR